MDRIVVNNEIMVGKPIIRNTRITVEQVLRWLAQGQTKEEILDNYPQLENEDVQAVLEYAADAVQSEKVYSLDHLQHA